jgi:hypothetical protein
LVIAEKVKSFAPDVKFQNFQPAQNSLSNRIKNPNATFVGTTRFVLRIDKQSEANYLELFSGLSAKKNPGKPVTAKVYDLGLFQKIKTEANVLLQFDQYKMEVREKFSLGMLKPGDYVIEVEDLQRAFNIRIEGQLHFNVIMSPDLVLQTSSVTGLNNFIVSIPEGVTQIIVNKSKSLKILTPMGRDLNFVDNKTSSHVIDVKKGEAGEWLFYYQAGMLSVEGIPPYIGMDPNRFLMPVSDQK